jgi:intracellular sulfur oxidation DsrE/DsrF family protein
MTEKIMIKYIQCMVLMVGTLLVFTATAEELNPDKPFAERHVLLQVSDRDAAKFSLTLDVANNLIRHYGGTDNIDVQIITFAGGVNMLINPDSNPNSERIKSLMDSDVTFVVCLNSLDTIKRKTGTRPVVLAGTKGVQTGVAYMLEKIHEGYIQIHP